MGVWREAGRDLSQWWDAFLDWLIRVMLIVVPLLLLGAILEGLVLGKPVAWVFLTVLVLPGLFYVALVLRVVVRAWWVKREATRRAGE